MAPLSGILGGHVYQIAILVRGLQSAMDSYVARLGVAFRVFDVNQGTSSFSGSSPQFQLRIAVALVGLSSIELIQPVSGITLYTRDLETRGPGLHHWGVYVDDLRETKDGLGSLGYQSILEGQIHGLGEFAYFQAPDMNCILEPLQLSSSLPRFLAANATWYSSK